MQEFIRLEHYLRGVLDMAMDYTTFLYQALASDLGIKVAVEDYQQGCNRLIYNQKKDPAFSILYFRRSPVYPDKELWIIKNIAKELPPEDEAVSL
jgi:hypothetical protein